jgi:glucose/arabinose dehydrogenase
MAWKWLQLSGNFTDRHPSSPTAFRPQVQELETRDLPSTVLPAGFMETTLTSGLSGPTNMELAPDGRLFVLEQGGSVKLVRTDGTTATALKLTVDSSGERGLLGIAFDPSYSSTHFVYLYYTNPNGGGTATGTHNQISRFTVNDADPQNPTFGAETPILDLNNLSSATNHNGGGIHFGTDGMLYVGVGENANGANSQTLGNLLGKLLRVNVDGYAGGRDDTTLGHIIPADNPFVGKAAGINQLIFALGLRNPFTFAVQPGTGQIFINDVGQNTWEEIDLAVAGANYGWPNSEGFKTPTDTATTIGTYMDPLLAYNHSGGPAGGGCAIVGGVFYDPPTAQFPAQYVGKYFYEDLCGGWIRVFDPAQPGSLSNPDTSSGFAAGDANNTVALKVDSGGNLYYLSQTAGQVEKISYQPGGTANERFVTQLYVNLLGRQPDSSGLTSWTAVLNEGMSRTDVALAIEQSQEWRIDQVQALYQQFLRRAADASGLNGFVAFLSAGGTLEQAKSVLTGSAEYFQTRGGSTNDGFLAALYQDALSRSPDAGGLAGFTQALNQRVSRQRVAAAIFASPEYLGDLVAGFYQLYLKRAADNSGLNGFVASLGSGVPDQVVIAAILGSDEFFAHV